MRRLWSFFSSVTLTVALAAAICAAAAWGSIVTMRNQPFFTSLDRAVLFDALAAAGGDGLRLTLWVWVLVFLTFLFGVNAFVCTADKVSSILKSRLPVRALFPHIVHVGFLVALVGHLAGSVWGFRSFGNVLPEGAPVPVPHMPGLSMRLDSVESSVSRAGELESLKTRITILRGAEEMATGEMGVNSPFFHNGAAFYHMDQGEAPTGLILAVDGKDHKVGMGEEARTADGRPIFLGEVVQGYAATGGPADHGGGYPIQGIEVFIGGAKALLPLGAPGASSAVAGGSRVVLKDYVVTPYAVVTVNRDPGIYFIIAGSAILVAGMVLLLFFRGERTELVRSR